MAIDTVVTTYSDVGIAREQHDEAINADAEAASRRQAMLQRHAKLLILAMGLVVSTLLVLKSSRTQE